jgi:hypothetical protein
MANGHKNAEGHMQIGTHKASTCAHTGEAKQQICGRQMLLRPSCCRLCGAELQYYTRRLPGHGLLRDAKLGACR